MGMCSYFNWEDVTIVDLDGLKKYLADLKDGKYEDRKPVAPDRSCADVVEIVDDKTLTFSQMDEWKIISYWYGNFVCFLRDIAVFIEGEVHWTFENSDEGGYVVFRDGELVIYCGHMEWQQFTPEQICNPKKQYRKGIDKLPEELQRRLAARRI